MPSLILTGAPGAGKTTLLLALERKGFAIVREAASDVMALALAEGVERPWEGTAFIPDILALQLRRADLAPDDAIHDRSVICTLALCRFLGTAPPADLLAACAELAAKTRPKVAMIALMDFVTPTEIRRISHTEAVAFETLHHEAYRDYGFSWTPIAPGPIEQRLSEVENMLGPD